MSYEEKEYNREKEEIFPNGIYIHLRRKYEKEYKKRIELH